jgi:hypothetical protein
MQIEIFTIADAATIHCGKLNLLGSFDHLNAPEFPAVHRECCIVTKLRMGDQDSGEHELEVRIIDPDGISLIEPTKGTFSASIEFGKSGHHTLLWNLRKFPLPKPGVFYIDALVDGTLLSRTPLFVSQTET